MVFQEISPRHCKYWEPEGCHPVRFSAHSFKSDWDCVGNVFNIKFWTAAEGEKVCHLQCCADTLSSLKLKIFKISPLCKSFDRRFTQGVKFPVNISTCSLVPVPLPGSQHRVCACDWLWPGFKSWSHQHQSQQQQKPLTTGVGCNHRPCHIILCCTILHNAKLLTPCAVVCHYK